MIRIDTLENKPIREVKGEEIVDLTFKSLNEEVVMGYSRVVLTTSEMVMRPDLIAHMYCGSHNKVGTLLKINSISNPFSLNEGDILFIPDSRTLSEIIAKPAEAETSEIRKSFRKQLQERISRVSEQRKEYLNSVDISASAVLPPNVINEGDEQFKVLDGKLIFGSDIGVCRTRIQQNRSAATIKSRFAQRQIFET
jgi:hypothetical protein